MQTGLLSAERILKGSPVRQVGRRILILDSVSSTNDIAWGQAEQPDSDGLCVFAETQTAGRGRRGRTWQSGRGDSLLFSVLLRDRPLPADILTLASAVAVAESVAGQFPLHIQIKWPNDVLIEKKKICGILTESRNIRGRMCLVVGIGLNVNQSREFFLSLGLETPATSLAIETGQETDRNALAALILNSLDHWLSVCRYAPGEVGQVWKRYNRQIGSQIRILENQQEFSGTCIDIDPAKGLVVQLNHGPIRFFRAANCTVIPA
jgi:BirA family biotin operon repressor/biotin-[acetyl-CoA-carboxylase] ligase